MINSYSDKDEAKDKTYELPPEEPEDDKSTIDSWEEETSSVNENAKKPNYDNMNNIYLINIKVLMLQ